MALLLGLGTIWLICTTFGLVWFFASADTGKALNAYGAPLGLGIIIGLAGLSVAWLPRLGGTILIGAGLGVLLVGFFWLGPGYWSDLALLTLGSDLASILMVLVTAGMAVGAGILALMDGVGEDVSPGSPPGDAS